MDKVAKIYNVYKLIFRTLPILTGALRNIHPWDNYLMNAYYGKPCTRSLTLTVNKAVLSCF